MEKNNPILKQLEDIIGTKVSMAESAKTKARKEQEYFCSVVQSWDEAWARGLKVYDEGKIDMADYDATFYQIIETLFVMAYGEFKTEIIAWWVYERFTAEGELAVLVTEDDKEHEIKTPLELFKFIKSL